MLKVVVVGIAVVLLVAVVATPRLRESIVHSIQRLGASAVLQGRMFEKQLREGEAIPVEQDGGDRLKRTVFGHWSEPLMLGRPLSEEDRYIAGMFCCH